MEFIQNFVDVFMSMAFYIMIGLFFVGILHTYIKKESVLKALGKDNFGSVIKSSIVGVPLPLCSCGVVPTALELKKSGASNGAVTSFLISTPQTGVDSIFATYSAMGLVMAIYRPFAAFISGIIGGGLVNAFAKNEVIKLEEKPACCCCGGGEVVPEVAKKPRFIEALQYGFIDFLDEISWHFFVGMIIATLISTFVPADFFVSLGLNHGVLAMLAMVILGLPMYICSTSSIPVALSLVTKGLSMGGAFVFLFTGPVTNIASLLVIAKALGKKITALYIGSVAVCSIVFGLLLDFVIGSMDINIIDQIACHSDHGSHANHFIAIVFAGLMIYSLAKKLVKKFNKA